MKSMKKLLSLLLAVTLLVGTLPMRSFASEVNDYIYLSVSYDGKYINAQNGKPIVYQPVSLKDIAAIDLRKYGLENMLYDADGDGAYETTALQLLIYAHETLYGGNWKNVSFDATPGSSYFKDGIFGFTENLVYFLNGDFPVDESQTGGWYTVGATSDRIVLEAGDFLDVASFECYSFLWDMLGGFHLFADQDGNYVHDYTANVGESMSVKLKHSFCDLMYGESWVVEAADYEVYYGAVFGEAEGSVTTDDSGNAEITFPKAGTYYVWCDGAMGSDDGTHSVCDHYFAYGEPCIVSSPAYAKVTVVGAEEEPSELSVSVGHTLALGNDISIKYGVAVADVAAYDSFYLECQVPLYEGDELIGYSGVELDGERNGASYVFVLDGITAKMMNDTVLAKLHVTKGAQEYCSAIDEYSVAKYAYNQLNKASATDALKAVCANLLRYGAMAQSHFAYRTDALVDANMTPADKSYLTDLDTVVLCSNLERPNDLENPSVSWKGVTLELGNKVIINYGVRLDDYAGYPADLCVRVSYIDNTGAEMTRDLPLTDKNSYYLAQLDCLYAAQMRTVVTAAVYEGETRISTSYVYSIETYAARVSNAALKPLCAAMIAYGDSAASFFAN